MDAATIDQAGATADLAQLPPFAILSGLADCLPAIGSDDFIDRFLHVVRLTGARQVTAFAHDAIRARCLLSRNFLSEEKGGTLAAAYVNDWFVKDPLRTRVLAMTPDSCVVDYLEDLLPCLDPGYIEMFFGAPGFRTKAAVLVTQGTLRLVINLYFTGANPAGVEAGIYHLIGRTLATHLLRVGLPEFPLPLAVLSERERQVCIRMLAGKKAEIIAEEIGVAASSVVTYRQRAYQKLGISSRGQLFAICRS